ncbi:hypothetical protein QP835_11895 [Pseudomonas oryzihabitans]|uniref:hypothetical protein n=1 Tax=Pseudomonas oryzihabitans TaxID=47885 RepID=UPI00255652F3|nr:hypothetical protein [Pseudomonas oryzihabitans]MDK8264972.1 hypothetical protein [Pseudomonas oryzihabitans]
MSAVLYEIAFQGELVAGADAQQTRQNLMRLFQADEQRIAVLFSGRRMIIKNRLDAATAERYRATLAQAGARVEVAPMAETGEPAAAPVETQEPAATAPTAASAAERGSLSVAPRDAVMAAFVDVQAPDFGLAPVGADLQDTAVPVAAPQVDLSRLSLAPVGSDLGPASEPLPVAVPDTDHLTLVRE